MKVLLTGTTASQVSPKRNPAIPTFSGLVNKALLQDRHDVTWVNPSVTLSKEYLDEFDSIVVGLAPPTSTAAHRIYGALSVSQLARELGKLVLVVDAPEPKRIWSGIRAIYNKPQDLTKSFYSKRQEYKKVENTEVLERLNTSIKNLYTKDWERTIFPVFPWMSFPSVSEGIPMTSRKNLYPLNLDSFIIFNTYDPQRGTSSEEFWVADAINTKWTSSIEETVYNPVRPVKTSKWEDNDQVVFNIKNSIGCLVSVYKKGDPWWSPHLSQALAVNTPVVTDWRLASLLGSDWSVLAHRVEELSPEEKSNLANNQKISYVNAIPSQKESVESVCKVILER